MRAPVWLGVGALSLCSPSARSEGPATHSAITPVELVTHTGHRVRACRHELVLLPPLGDAPATEETRREDKAQHCPDHPMWALGMQFVEDGVQLVHPEPKGLQGRGALAPTDGGTLELHGDPRYPSGRWALVRHYDGQVSLVAFDGRLLAVSQDGALVLQQMDPIADTAKFTLLQATVDGRSLLKPAFDCSTARIQEIRTRYSKVANNPALETKVVSKSAEHEYTDSETHRYYQGFVAEEHVYSGFSGAEWNRYTYRWEGQDPYFEYVVGVSDADGTKTEIRRYAGEGGPDGPLCRCLFRETDLDAGGPPGPQLQRSCQHKTVAPAPEARWEPVGGSAPPLVP